MLFLTLNSKLYKIPVYRFIKERLLDIGNSPSDNSLIALFNNCTISPTDLLTGINKLKLLSNVGTKTSTFILFFIFIPFFQF